MRKIIVTTFISMDGVLQAPGGPEEDRTNSFKWGGWMFPHGDDVTDKAIAELMHQPFDLLLGRRTYEIFAAYWPYQENHPVAEKFNSIGKYVVSSQSPDLSWENSTLITGDVVEGIKKLKQQDGPNLLVHGSGKLVQTLLQHNLIDELHTWIHPITLGGGKKLFEEGTQPANWKLTNSIVASTGVIIASYVPDGDVKLGSFVADDPSEKEKARRERIERGQW
ncbi:MAG: dihydrofolate reductase family protein [Mucilaginibacter sp.]|uniref:dihydrofolate reductase family protein n=1 Tax=Mucilaginibacter sp. TaxID=1882438 RepID=UPI003262E2ED